jgi:hypothetical protein
VLHTSLKLKLTCCPVECCDPRWNDKRTGRL